MPLDLLAHLKALSAPPGLSGYEGPARAVIQAAWAPLSDEQHQDRLGSFWAVQRGSGAGARPRLMLAAHMDAIGLIVTRREGEFLRVSNIGGIDPRVLPGQLVTVHGRQDLPAVVAAPPAFLLPKAKRDGVTPLAELLIDTGLPADKLARLVQVGDLVSFAQPPVELLNEQLAAKSLDNRASVAALTVCLEALRGKPHAWDVFAVATVQEEVGLRGAGTSAYSLEPDLAVAVDVTYGSDNATREFAHRTLPLGGGPALGLGPNIHAGLLSAFKACATRVEIPYTVEFMPGHSGTDAFAIQVARAGIPTMVVSIPLRNMHTPVEVVALKDIARTGRLLAEFAAGLDDQFMAGLSVDGAA
jgi:putative aminopeptidase FrvX